MSKKKSVLCIAVALILGLALGAGVTLGLNGGRNSGSVYDSSYSGTCGDKLTWKIQYHSLTISGTGEMEDYSEENPAPWEAYAGNFSMVEVEKGVTSIGNYAFYNCGAYSYYLPDGLTKIGDYAFSGCKYLNSLNLPSSVTDISATAFSGSDFGAGTCGDGLTWKFSLHQLTISGSGAMTDYSADNPAPWTEYSFTSIRFNGSVTHIGNYAFYGSSLSYVTIPDSVTGIGSMAFGNCTRLTSLSIPSGIKEIAEDAFSGAASSAGKCGDSLVWMNTAHSLIISGTGDMYNYSIENPAPWANSDVYNITVKNGVTSIGDYAFASMKDCTIGVLVLPQSITSIGQYAFYSLAYLSTINIPAGVTKIASNAFRDYAELSTILYCGTEAQFKALGVHVPTQKYSGNTANVVYHDYSYKVTTAATCDKEGVGTYTCKYCGGSYTEAIAATGHTYQAVVTAPTCTEKGYTTHTCKDCGDSYVDSETEALGHDYAEGTIAATCVPGYNIKICKRCSDMQTEMLPATGEHTYADGVCTVCGQKETK